MLYKTDIANLALGKLGVSLSIVDLETENTQQAKVVRRHFRMALDAILELHNWSFATQYQALALHSEDPGDGYGYAYVMPSDALVIRQIASDGIFPRVNQYESEKEKWQEVYSSMGQLIYTDVQDAYAKYTTRLPDSIAFPNYFGRAFAAQLALDIAPSLITNNFGKVRDTLYISAKNDISLGIAEDLGRQPLQEDSLSPFIRARL